MAEPLDQHHGVPFDLVKALIERLKEPVVSIEPSLDPIEPLIDPIEPLVERMKPPVEILNKFLIHGPSQASEG